MLTHQSPLHILTEKHLGFQQSELCMHSVNLQRVNFDELSEIIDKFDSRHTRKVIKLQILAAMPPQPTGICQSKLSNDDF